MTAAELVPVTPGLFTLEADGSGCLIGGYCPSCARYHFPCFPSCPYCSAEGCQERLLSRRGTLVLFTSVRNRPPGYQGEVPFGFGIVELPEEIRIVARLTQSDPEQLRPGMAVVLALTSVDTDEQGRTVVSYAFAPAAE
jgi:uncharacterized OB-fold protein